MPSREPDPELIALAAQLRKPGMTVASALNAAEVSGPLIRELRRALAEKAAEIARLQAELDGLRQVPVEYAPTAALEAAMAADPAREDGTVLRETGGERRAFEWKAAAGEWVRIS